MAPQKIVSKKNKGDIYMTTLNSFTWENFNSVCPNCDERPAWFVMMTFLHVTVIPFLQCFHLSLQFNGLKFQSGSTCCTQQILNKFVGIQL